MMKVVIIQTQLEKKGQWIVEKISLVSIGLNFYHLQKKIQYLKYIDPKIYYETKSEPIETL